MRKVRSGYRYYSPELGRWLSRDPIESSVHLYLLCRNASVSWIDPFGLAEIHNRSKMKLVIIGSETLKYKTMKDCKCDPGKQEKEKFSAIPVVLDKDKDAKPGDPLEDIDAAIDLDGKPYKSGGKRKIKVTGGPPPAALNFTLVGGWPGGYGKKPTTDFWLPAGLTIVQRCDQAITQLKAEKKFMLICGKENKKTIDRVDALITMIQAAKQVLQTTYNLSPPSPTPAPPTPPSPSPPSPSPSPSP